MKILHTTPAQDGFYMPAEFAPHEGCLMIWPERADSWQYGAYAARKAFLRVIETISESESMTVLCSEGQYDNARAQLPDRVRLVVMETDDAWARDVGPTFVINGRGERRGIDWGFNAWGGDVDGLYPSWEKDNRVARKFCDLVSNDVYDKRDFICEGGSIHSDGEGTALVTEACLLSAGRNPDLTKTQIEQVLCDYLGVSKVIWLPRGIYNDETNEHVDNVCAFTGSGGGCARVDGRRDRPAVCALQGQSGCTGSCDRCQGTQNQGAQAAAAQAGDHHRRGVRRP